MDYEKAYKEALAKCKAYIDDTQKRWSEEFCKATEEVFFEIFPELKEPEGEKIRKAQLDYWRSVGGKEWHGVPVQKVIAWLEKQAPKPQRIISAEAKEALYDKPKWTEEDEENFRDIISAIHSVAYQTTEDEEARIEWLKSIKKRWGNNND